MSYFFVSAASSVVAGIFCRACNSVRYIHQDTNMLVIAPGPMKSKKKFSGIDAKPHPVKTFTLNGLESPCHETVQ